MPSIFSRLDAIAQASVNRVMATDVEFIGMKGGSYSYAPDPDRPPARAKATPMIGGATGKFADASGSGDVSQRSYLGSAVYLTAAEHAKLPWRPRQQDRVRIEPDQPGHTTYHITRLVPLDGGDFEIHLTEDSR